MIETNQENAIGSAVHWLEAVGTGQVATSIAILAVAGLGFLLLSGRIGAVPFRRTLLGCFIIFGAGTIASGLMQGAGGAGDAPGPAILPFASAPPQPTPQPKPAEPYDPYAGASLQPGN